MKKKGTKKKKRTNYSSVFVLVVIALLIAIGVFVWVNSSSAPSAEPAPDGSGDVGDPADDPNGDSSGGNPADDPSDDPADNPGDGDGERNPLLAKGETEQAIPDDGVVSFTEGGISYSVLVDGNAFLRARGADYERFYLLEASSSDVFVEFRFIADTDAETLSPAFFDSYFDYNEYEDDGAVAVGKSTAQHIIASNDAITMEAFLIDTDGGVICLISSRTFAAQKSSLYGVINSFVLAE